ncbi:MAG TPA: TIGR04255 family protein [Chloroflexota bacterium]|nr:TIGR04255 family protein [Chloroflexota bacterium]
MARPRPAHLPNFRNPPVAETVLAIQLDRIPPLRAAHLGLLWNEFKDRFPKTEEKPPLEPVLESFPAPLSPAPQIWIRPTDPFPVPRLWFLNDQGNEMIQVQPDRFISNWRKQPAEASYPHYDATIRPNFDRDFGTFLAFIERQGLGSARVNQCEISYVNHLPAGIGWKDFGDIEKVFTFWRSGTPEAEDLRLHLRSVIKDEVGSPIGRLHVDLQPAVRVSDGSPMYVFHLTARGQIGDGVDFLDRGRESIVMAFDRLTTPEMHKIWGKY